MASREVDRFAHQMLNGALLRGGVEAEINLAPVAYSQGHCPPTFRHSKLDLESRGQLDAAASLTKSELPHGMNAIAFDVGWIDLWSPSVPNQVWNDELWWIVRPSSIRPISIPRRDRTFAHHALTQLISL
jgi:hypothetical protein